MNDERDYSLGIVDFNRVTSYKVGIHTVNAIVAPILLGYFRMSPYAGERRQIHHVM